MLGHKKLNATLLLVGAIVAASTSEAKWFILSNERELEGYTIVEVGEVEDRHYYDPETLQTLEWLEFKSYRTRCFLFSEGDHVLSSSSIPSLILRKVVAGKEIVKIALLEPSYGSLSVEVKDVRFVSCPAFLPY